MANQHLSRKLKQRLNNSPRYLHGLLNELKTNHSDLFNCYTNTRMRTYKTHEGGKKVEIQTEGDIAPDPQPFSSAKGHSILANHLVMTTNIPLSKTLSPSPQRH